MILIRPYTKKDREVCLSLFDGNAPPFFDPSERSTYKAFLEGETFHAYRIFERDGTVVACGGYAIEEEMGDLCWGIVSRRAHGEKLGWLLLLYRLNKIAQDESLYGVHLDTSQHIEKFYEKLGFRTIMVTDDYYGAGLHRHDMELMLTSEKRTEIESEYRRISEKLEVRERE